MTIFFCGASCHFSFEITCRKAVSELSFAIWNRYKTTPYKLSPELIQDPLDHERYYMEPNNCTAIEHLFEGEFCGDVRDCEVNTLSEIIGYLRANNWQILLKEITCREIKNGHIDAHVVRAIIPGLIPMTFGNFNEPLGLGRIYEVPYNLGIRKDRLTVKSLLRNYAPHFFHDLLMEGFNFGTLFIFIKN